MILEYCRRKFWNCTEALNQVQLCSGGGGGGVEETQDASVDNLSFFFRHAQYVLSGLHVPFLHLLGPSLLAPVDLRGQC